MDSTHEFNSETIKLFCSDYGLNPKSFDWKDFSIASLFPSQGIDDFKESWLNHAIADLANMDEKEGRTEGCNPDGLDPPNPVRNGQLTSEMIKIPPASDY